MLCKELHLCVWYLEMLRYNTDHSCHNVQTVSPKFKLKTVVLLKLCILCTVTPCKEGLSWLLLATKEVSLGNICLATLFVVLMECLRAAKLEQNVLAYISDF